MDTMGINKNTFILPNGRTIAETEHLHNERIKALYIECWNKDISPTFRDDRCTEPNLYIKANKDGSEDLVRFDTENRTYTHVRRLSEAGQGYFYRYFSV